MKCTPGRTRCRAEVRHALLRRLTALSFAASITIAGISRAADDIRVGSNGADGTSAADPHGDGTDGGAGESVSASASASGASTEARGSAAGGDGGRGGDGGLGNPPGTGSPGRAGNGGIGGNASAHTSNSSTASLISLRADSFGGAGGAPGASVGTIATTGRGGLGGNAISSIIGLSTTDQAFKGFSSATGGAGGSASGLNYYGNGGDGGSARASLNLTTATMNTLWRAIDANVLASGGGGGAAFGAGFTGGAGGLAVIHPSSLVNNGIGYASLTATQTGGNGGDGLNLANGGDGASSFLADKLSGSSGGWFEPQQYANGGKGGNSEGGTAGRGGDARVSLSTSNPNGHIQSWLISQGGAGGAGINSISGAGGNATGYINVTASRRVVAHIEANGGRGGGGAFQGASVVGAAGGTATIVNPFATGSDNEGTYLEAWAVGGAGGDSSGAGNRGHDGALASIVNVRATGNYNSVQVTAAQIGGDGGAGFFGADGGDGAASHIVNQVSGQTQGVLRLTQGAGGGRGGDGATGGLGGAASSHLDYNDADGSLNTYVYAVGGAAGTSTGGNGRPGADATVSSNLSSAFDIYSEIASVGGQGGNGANGGIGGQGILGEIHVAASANHSATINASSTGGNGGDATSPNGTSGAGRSVVLNNVIDGSAGSLIIAQTAKGGFSGNGANVANGGSATSNLSLNNPSGVTNLQLTATAEGGGAGQLLNPAGIQGNGGDAVASADAYSTTAQYVSATATANGGLVWDYETGLGGGNGGSGTATASATADGLAQPIAIATAGGGYASTFHLTSGVGGEADATATATALGDGPAYAEANARGGDAGYTFNVPSTGLAGTDGTATASASNAGSTQVATASATATGGRGGGAFGIGHSGGPGGVPHVNAAATSPAGGPVSSRATAVGGEGGNGFGGAVGGPGRDVTLTNAFNVSTTGSIEIYQSAVGGIGGYADVGAAGPAGNAASNISFSYTGTLVATSSATGGDGGGVTTSGTPTSGGNAIASINISSALEANATAIAIGGFGGSVSGVGNGKDGGMPSFGTVYASSTGGDVTVAARGIGGNGGSGGGTAGAPPGGNGNGGNGASVSLFNVPDGDAPVVTLIQSATGGRGSWANEGIPGAAGRGRSELDITKHVRSLTVEAKANSEAAGSRTISLGVNPSGTGSTALSTATNTLGQVTSKAVAFGGDAGYGDFILGGRGGDNSATARANANGDPESSYADASATGGAGGQSRATIGGAGGDATANAFANSSSTTSSDSQVNAHSLASGGYGGSTMDIGSGYFPVRGGDGGAAVSSASASAPASTNVFSGAEARGGVPGVGTMGALSGRSGDASATSSASGLQNVISRASASSSAHPYTSNFTLAHSSATGQSGNIQTDAANGLITTLTDVPLTGEASAESRTYLSRPLPDPGVAASVNAASFATALPRPADYLSMSASAPIVQNAFGGVTGATGVAIVGAASPSTTTQSTTYTSNVVATFDTAQFPSGNVLLGFINPTFTGPAFEQLQFQAIRDSHPVIDQTFTSVAAAQAYFTNNVINIPGDVPGSDPIGIQFQFKLTTSDPSSGFSASFVFGHHASRILNTSGNWNDASNWSNGAIPNSPDAHADLITPVPIASPAHLRLNGDRKIARLTLDHAYVIESGPAPATLTIGSPAISAQIDVLGGHHTIAAPLSFAAPAAGSYINVTAGASLTIDSISLAQSPVLNKVGPGALTINSLQDHRATFLGFEGGQVTLNANLGAPATSESPAEAPTFISITGSSLILHADQDVSYVSIAAAQGGNQSLDLNSGAASGEFRSLRIHMNNIYAHEYFVTITKPYLAALIKHARDNPGDGIFDSGLASHPSSALGIAELIDAYGQPYILLRPTRIGDLNLDGSVTISDFIDLASHFNGSGTWQEGDLNYDGLITISDFIDLAANFNSSYAGETWPISAEHQLMLDNFAASVGANAIPEPSALVGLVFPTIALVTRRRRRGPACGHLSVNTEL